MPQPVVATVCLIQTTRTPFDHRSRFGDVGPTRPIAPRHANTKLSFRMKIAHVSPLYESVPPKLYGGTERVVSYLTEELVARTHDVTLFASADSVTRARL